MLAALTQAMQPDPTAELTAAIRNAAWFVRWYCRPHQHVQKAQALTRLGLAVRAAFNASEDFEPLLYAIRDTVPSVHD